MATVSLVRRHRALQLPLWVFVNDQMVGFMKGDAVHIEMPEGVFEVGVRIVLLPKRPDWAVGGGRRVVLSHDSSTVLRITDKERWWNVLFDVDLLLWLAGLFFSLPHPWHLVYKAASDGFFAVWLLRIWLRRKRYFTLEPVAS